MDPNACYQRWLTAVQEEDIDEATSAWRDLRDWLVRGGFPPDWNERQRHEFRCWVPVARSRGPS